MVSCRVVIGESSRACRPDRQHFVYTRMSRIAANSGIFPGSLDVRPEQQDLGMGVSAANR
jgi:hypothetical protein